MRAAQASASLRICADSPESSLLENALCINLIMISLKVDSILERIVLNQGEYSGILSINVCCILLIRQILIASV